VDEIYLTVDDAAKVLAVSPYTLRQWLKAGKVRGIKIGTKWRVTRAALNELAQTNAPQAALPTTTGATGTGVA
jgi:excisionase family DNA binding protein